MKNNYEELSIERKQLQKDGLLPEWFQTAGWQLLKDKYLDKGDNLKNTFKRMAQVAASHLKGKVDPLELVYIERRFFEIMWDGDLAPSSPTYNLGTNRGMPVSCSGGLVKDEVLGFYQHRLEVASLTKESFGTSGYLGDIRPRGSKISRGGTASGVVPVFVGIAQDMIDITQGTMRRGSYGGYIPVSHGDFHELVDLLMVEPDGKNLGINYHDNDVKAVLSNDPENDIFRRWQKHMKLRSVFGKGYFYFPDRVARLQPKMYTDEKEFVFKKLSYDIIPVYHDYAEKFITVDEALDLFNKGETVRLITDTKTLLTLYKYEKSDDGELVELYTKRILRSRASNLCTEITLHQDELHTYACVLSSMNGANYDRWKNTDAVFIATIFLDCINEELIAQAKKKPAFENIIRGAEKGRPLGLGLLGFHSYLQSKMVAFESTDAMDINDEMFNHLKSESLRASQYLAKKLGEPEWCEGYGVRNTHLLAIAPNMSSALLTGGHSQGIEPIVSNSYLQKMAGGSVNRINPTLMKIMKERGVYNQEMVDYIGMDLNGSVQHESIDWLTPKEKLVFKTAYEINQYTIIELAADRQQYICQAQSINLFFKAIEDEKAVADVVQYAMSNKWIKSLYYQRSESATKGSNGKDEMSSILGSFAKKKPTTTEVVENVCVSCEG